LNPEPYAYESALAARWLIQDQIAGKSSAGRGSMPGAPRPPADSKIPLLLWGPYLWADGTTSRKADGLTYVKDDFANDGTHPNDVGRRKVAQVMLTFFKNDPLTASWFTGRSKAVRN
jgi:hypothetical protein